MDRVLRPHAEYAAAYLDYVIVHSDSWQQHLQHVAAVLESLRQARLMANPKKCATEGGMVSGVPLRRQAGASAG